MYNIFYTSEAEENLFQIFLYIGNDSRFFATKVISSIKNTIDILKVFPYSGKNISDKINMIVETTYKYNIVYEVKGNNIYIISIFKYKNTRK